MCGVQTAVGTQIHGEMKRPKESCPEISLNNQLISGLTSLSSGPAYSVALLCSLHCSLPGIFSFPLWMSSVFYWDPTGY